jgi:hypothetical protein
MFDLNGGIDFSAANLVGGTALLAPLKNYTSSDPALAHAFPFTHALLPGSPALDAGLNFLLGFTVPFLDARGLPRFVNTVADLGAFESSGFTVTLPPGAGFPADAAPAPAPAGDTKYRTLIDHYFVNADGTTKTDFQAQVTPNNAIEPIDGGVIRFFAGTSGSGSTGIPDNDPGTVTIDDSDGDMTALVKTNVKADSNPTGGLLPNFYELRASAGGAVGGINESVQAWRLFNQFVDGLGFSARPQTTRSGDTVIFAVDALTFSTAFSIFLQDQEGHPLNISSENVTVRAAGGPGQIDFATPLPVAGVVTQPTVAGVATFQGVKITKSSFSQLYQIEARFENPNGTIVSQLSDPFRILPNTLFIDKASSSQKFFSNKRVSPIVIVVHTPRGNFNIIRSFKKQNALGAVNKIVIVALDAVVDGAGVMVGATPASFWDGPIDLTIGNLSGAQPWDLAPLPPAFPLPGSRAFLKNVFVVAPNRRIVRAMAVGGVATVKGISPANNVNLFTTFATLRYPTPAERAAHPGFAIFEQDVILANTLVLPNAVNPTSQQFKRVTESRFRK